MKKNRNQVRAVACLLLPLSLVACSDDALFGGLPISAGEGEGAEDLDNTNIGFGGAGDFGFVRAQLDANQVPQASDIDDVGFFAEHQTTLPPPDCGDRVCPHAMLGAMANLVDGSDCTLLQVGLNSPLTIDPADRPPLTLAVAVDVSGSMQADDRIGFVRQGLLRLSNELDDEDQLAIVLYSSTARVALPLTPVAGHRNDIADIAQGLVADGSTNIFDGLDLAFGEVVAAFDATRQHRVILLSDGVATSGETSPALIRAMAAGWVDEGVPLTTVGVGTDFDLELMRGLAEDGDGNFYFLDDATAVDEVFTEEVATFLMPVAFDVTLSVDLGADWTLRNVYGVRDFVVNEGGNGGAVTLNAVYLAGRTDDDDTFEGEGRRGGGAALLLEVMPTTLDAADVSQVGEVTVEFTAPGASGPTIMTTSSPEGSVTLPARGRFSSRIVEKSFVMLNLVVGMRSAATAFYAGQPDEAASVLDGLVLAAADYEDSANDGAGDADIAADIALLEQFRDVIVAQGGTPDGDNEDDPWPAD
ncbi:MAG: VWA domain-containing protein [Deltaproteobacteria bacterium]|nr:VWA domain-containing protein [Deltaproteobacteria bacterium]